MKTALLLIDIHNDYFPGGRMELDGSPEASLRARDLLTMFRDRNLPIFHIQHISNRKGATFFLPDTAGVEIPPRQPASGRNDHPEEFSQQLPEYCPFSPPKRRRSRSVGHLRHDDPHVRGRDRARRL